MTHVEVDVEQLRSHKSSLVTRAEEVDSIAQEMATKSVGSFSMYGLLVGPLTYPILKLVGYGGESSIKNLGKLAEAMANNLETTATNYETAETNNTSLGKHMGDLLA